MRSIFAVTLLFVIGSVTAPMEAATLSLCKQAGPPTDPESGTDRPDSQTVRADSASSASSSQAQSSASVAIAGP